MVQSYPRTSQMDEIAIRPLCRDEIAESWRLWARNPDAHSAYIVNRLPAFFEIAALFDPCRSYLRRQRFVLGAFDSGRMIGTVAVERSGTERGCELAEHEWDAIYTRFSERDLDIYDTLQSALSKTYIGAPDGSLTIHSLGVETEYRGKGIGTRLLLSAIDELDRDEHPSLYVEIARIRWLQNLCESVGFRVVRRTFSISERLEFGLWGSVLMRYAPSTSG